jgi:protein-disulfide isomerase
MPSAAYRKKAKDDANRVRWIIAAIIGVIFLSTVIIFIWSASEAARKAAEPLPDFSFPAREMGSATAKITLEEFADYQCPFCGQFAINVQPSLIEKYIKTGKVHFVFRSLAFVDNTDPNQESHAAAIASLCAGEQNAFWQYHDIVFKHQTGENKGDFLRTNLISFAMQSNLDSVAFDQCLDSKKFTALLDADGERATFYKIDSTPTFVINREVVLIRNDMKTDLFAALDRALAKLGS